MELINEPYCYELSRFLFLEILKCVYSKKNIKYRGFIIVDYRKLKITKNKARLFFKRRVELIAVYVDFDTSNTGHANAIIIDNEFKRILFIEPWSGYFTKKRYLLFQKILKELFSSNPEKIELFDKKYINGNYFPIQDHLDKYCGKSGHCMMSVIIMIKAYINFMRNSFLFEKGEYKKAYNCLMETESKQILYNGNKLVYSLSDWYTNYGLYLKDKMRRFYKNRPKVIEKLQSHGEQLKRKDLTGYLDPGQTLAWKGGIYYSDPKNPINFKKIKFI